MAPQPASAHRDAGREHEQRAAGGQEFQGLDLAGERRERGQFRDPAEEHGPGAGRRKIYLRP